MQLKKLTIIRILRFPSMEKTSPFSSIHYKSFNFQVESVDEEVTVSVKESRQPIDQSLRSAECPMIENFSS